MYIKYKYKTYNEKKCCEIHAGYSVAIVDILNGIWLWFVLIKFLNNGKRLKFEIVNSFKNKEWVWLIKQLK